MGGWLEASTHRLECQQHGDASSVATTDGIAVEVQREGGDCGMDFLRRPFQPSLTRLTMQVSQEGDGLLAFSFFLRVL